MFYLKSLPKMWYKLCDLWHLNTTRIFWSIFQCLCSNVVKRDTFSPSGLHCSLQGHRLASGHWTGMFSKEEKVQLGQTDRNEAEGVDGTEQASLCSHRDTGRKGDEGRRAVCIWQRRENRQICLEPVDTELIFSSESNAWEERFKFTSEKECCTLAVALWLPCPISWALSLLV